MEKGPLQSLFNLTNSSQRKNKFKNKFTKI